MLSVDESQQIDAVLAAAVAPRAGWIDALMVVQAHRGWVSDEALADLAAYLAVSPAELEGLATFYNLIHRQPLGRHVILVCDSVSCWIMGYERLLAQLTAHLGIELGGTSADGRFTLLPNACLGCCDHAPALMIDEDLHVDVDVQQLQDLLARYP